MRASLLLFVLFFIPHLSESVNLDEVWDEHHQNMCNNEHYDTYWKSKYSKCFTYMYKFITIKIEVLNHDPVLIIYRDLISKTQTEMFLKEFRRKRLYPQVVFNTGEEEEVSTEIRNVNGTWLSPMGPSALSVYNTISQSIPSINFDSEELFSTLSYLPGGHYAPHFDYFYFHEDPEDPVFEKYGNRIATFILMLKKADKGGATVFPSIGTTVRAEVGDAFMWFNTKPTQTPDEMSLHGGCPVYEGEKVITTIWVRGVRQPLLSMVDMDKSFRLEHLIPGMFKPYRHSFKCRYR